MLKLIIISLYVSGFFTPNDERMRRETKEIDLKILNKQVKLIDTKLSIKLHLRLFNRSNHKLKLYMGNKLSDLCPVDWLPEYARPGFNIGIFDHKGRQQFREIIIFDTEADLQKNWENASNSIDSASTIVDKHFQEFRRRNLQNRNGIKLLSPQDSVTIAFDVDFHDLFLKKGDYELVVYYVINKKIYNHVDVKEKIFMGYARSNKVPLRVK